MLSRKKTTTSLIPVRLGALLIAANLIRSDAMANALMIARQTGRKIGELLITQGFITLDDLTAGLELQRLIKDGSITVELGTKALREAHDRQCSLKEALGYLGWSDQQKVKTLDLSTILLTAGLVTQEQLQQASWNSAKNYLPLGRNLVLSGSITPSLLGSALNSLILIRDGKVGFESAAKALRVCVQKKLSVEDALELHLPVSPNHVRVGELLSSAGLLSESDAMTAVESGLLNQRSIGQVLLQSQMVSPLVLDAALQLQQMIEQQRMAKTQAAELLRQVATKQVRLDEFLSEMSYLKSRVLHLLVASGLVSDDEIAISMEACSAKENDIIRALFATGALTQDLFRTCVRAVYAIEEGELTEGAAFACLRSRFASHGTQEATQHASLGTFDQSSAHLQSA